MVALDSNFPGRRYSKVGKRGGRGVWIPLSFENNANLKSFLYIFEPKFLSWLKGIIK